ncbi:MAG: DUF2062 domain-containing protein [Phycisphaerales bacterium]|nr:MAG: DUF2062 domain-containing protein [Phycisphaerales bacterium]
MGQYLYKFRRILLHKVLHTNDTPHQVALGVALAMFVAFLPLVGFQTAIAIGLAALFRANKAVCIPIVWITNPFTIVPIYGTCLALGKLIMASPAADEAEVLQKLQQGQEAAKFFEWAFWKNVFSILMNLGAELWVGCLIISTVAAVVSYFLARQGLIGYRERRRRKLLKRELFRSRHQRGKVIRRSDPT